MFAARAERNNDITSLTPLIDIAVRFDHFLEGVAAIDDWRESSARSKFSKLALSAPVHVLITHDIVLAEIIAGLHFDQLQYLAAGVL